MNGGSADPTVEDRSAAWNLGILSIWLITMRTGWIFKTESVVIPHVLDIISGDAGWARGWLPVLNRLGQSVPPLLAADAVRDAPLKKRKLLFTTLGMAWPFLLLAVVWSVLEDRRQPWLVPAFLVLYFLFFTATGLNQLVDGTLQGKLIRANQRGRLLGTAGMMGSITATTAAIVLLRPWMAIPGGDGFTYVFLFNGIAFLVAGLLANLCQEQPDPVQPSRQEAWWHPLLLAWQTFRQDRRFRRAAWMAALFMSGLLLFPHYQALARQKLGSTAEDLVWWVIAQNLSVGVFSLLIGQIADRFGNRLALRLSAALAACTPIIAISFTTRWNPLGPEWYWLTYVFLGVFPVTMKTISNYTLELVPREQHPRYLSTMTVCYTAPFLLSPLFGAVMDLVPQAWPFLFVSGTTAIGALLTFRMAEPRWEQPVE
jgi:MFS family permease